jgi:hypothetical protein
LLIDEYALTTIDLEEHTMAVLRAEKAIATEAMAVDR